MERHGPVSRHELIRLKKRLSYTDRAVRILERKRNVLLFEFLELLDRRHERRAELHDTYEWARQRYVVAAMREGLIFLHGAAESRPKTPELLFVDWKLRSVPIPMILSRDIQTTLEERGYGIIGTDADIDAVAAAYERVLSTVVSIAEIDSVLHALITNIGETIRRINVIKYRLVPKLERRAKYIGEQLEEREQEERVYQRIAKRLLERKRAERDTNRESR